MKIINMLSLGGNTLTGNTLTGNTLTGNTSTASHFSSLILTHFLNNIPSSNSAHLRALLIFGLCSSSGSAHLRALSSCYSLPVPLAYLQHPSPRPIHTCFVSMRSIFSFGMQRVTAGCSEADWLCRVKRRNSPVDTGFPGHTLRDSGRL
ncbi:YALIA101S10e00958g1_1 [Yarrowia lipolytica]|nr:YALIA101S10e00958g1_1 [Yarrowia lipolytica]